jgi:hypothetical protein
MLIIFPRYPAKKAGRGHAMNTDRNPIYRKGKRNPFCLHYSTCLDEAVKKTWAFWDCGECEHRASRDPKLEITNRANDSMPYYDVPVDIFEEVC